jgi:hypothetical protein
MRLHSLRLPRVITPSAGPQCGTAPSGELAAGRSQPSLMRKSGNQPGPQSPLAWPGRTFGLLCQGNGRGYLPPREHGRLAARAWVRPPIDLRCTWRVPPPGIQHSASSGGCPVPRRPAPKSRWPPGQPAGRRAGAGELPPGQVRGRQRMLRHRCPAAAVLPMARRAHAHDVGGRPAGVGGSADVVSGPSMAAGPQRLYDQRSSRRGPQQDPHCKVSRSQENPAG